MKKGERRNYSGISLKTQRIDKRFPKRVKTTIEQDLGRRYKVTQISSPCVETSEQIVDKKASGKWLTLYDRNGLCIRKSLVSGDVYAWHRIGKATEYIGKLENADLWTLGIVCLRAVEAFSEIVQKTVKGIQYMRYVLSLRKAPKDLFSGR
jgi:hypothetical protein